MKTFSSLLLCLGLCLTASAAPLSGNLGLQLWSLRETFKTDVPKGLADTQGFGVRLVETYSVYGQPPAEFKAKLEAHQLKAVAMHTGYERFKSDLQGIVTEAKALGVTYVAIPWIPYDPFTPEVAKTLAAEFNTWGAALAKEGLQFAFHPHGHEFLPVSPGASQACFDVLVENTDPKLVSFEMDVYWFRHGGADPEAYLEKYPGRFSLLHIKDRRIGALDKPGTRGGPVTDKVAVGKGSFHWARLLQKADKAGVQYYFIEDETTDPYANIPESLRFLNELKP